jgi:TP901 family phage tail tape measure protein
MPISPSRGTPGLGGLVLAIAADIKDLKKGFDDAQKQTQNFVKKTDKQLKEFSNNTKNTFSNLGQTLAAGFFLRQMAGLIRKNLVAPLIEFQDQLSTVSTMLNTNVGPTMEKFRDDLLQIGAEFGGTTKNLTKGLFDTLSATIPAAEAMEQLRVGAIAASAGATTIDVALRTLNRTILQFPGFSALEISDILFRGLQRALGTFEQLAAAMPGVIATAKPLNLSLEELVGTTAFLSRSFPSVSQAAKGLEGVLRDFIRAPESLRKTLRMMGTSIGEVQVLLGERGLQGTIQFLIDQDMGRGLLDSLFRRAQALKAINAMKAEKI